MAEAALTERRRELDQGDNELDARETVIEDREANLSRTRARPLTALPRSERIGLRLHQWSGNGPRNTGQVQTLGNDHSISITTATGWAASSS